MWKRMTSFPAVVGSWKSRTKVHVRKYEEEVLLNSLGRTEEPGRPLGNSYN